MQKEQTIIGKWIAGKGLEGIDMETGAIVKLGDMPYRVESEVEVHDPGSNPETISFVSNKRLVISISNGIDGRTYRIQYSPDLILAERDSACGQEDLYAELVSLVKRINARGAGDYLNRKAIFLMAASTDESGHRHQDGVICGNSALLLDSLRILFKSEPRALGIVGAAIVLSKQSE